MFVRACANFNGDGPRYDSALVEFQTGSNANQMQIGYVRICGCIQVDGNNLLYVRWYTNLPPSGALDNIFMTSLNRHLPALKWNPRTQTCNKSYGLIEPSSLRHVAWIVPDCKQENGRLLEGPLLGPRPRIRRIHSILPQPAARTTYRL